jgi:hypothetical protein
MAGRRKKEVPPIPEAPQYGSDETQWNAAAQRYEWKPAQREKLEAKRQAQIAKKEAHARVALASYNAKKGHAEKNDTRWDNPEEVRVADTLDFLQKSVSEFAGVVNCLSRDFRPLCRELNVIPNQFALENGVIAALEKADRPQREGILIAEAEFNTAYAEYHPLSNYKELSRLWELCAFDEYWKDKTFVDWLEYRRNLVDPKTKWWALTKVMGLNDLDVTAHTDLVNFLFPWDNIGLKREYTRQEFNEHLLGINGEMHRKLLCYPRSFFKSSVVQADLGIAQIALPDLTTTIITSTFALSRKFGKKFRSFFTVIGRRRTLLQQLFPEFTVTANDGPEVEYQNPMARFNEADQSVQTTSMGAVSTGAHMFYQILDDAADDENSKTVEGRENISDKKDSITETLISPYGFQFLVGTRYAGGLGLGRDGTGLCPDLYGVALNREAQEPEPALQVLIKGAWTPKPGCENKAVSDLQENEVDLLWPSKNGPGSWKVLAGKRRANLQNFCHQLLNMPIGFAEEELHIFSKEEFERGMLVLAQIPVQARWCQFWDLSYGREDGDFSAGITVATWKDMAGLTHLAIVDAMLRKLKPSLISNEIVDFFKRHPRVDSVFIEKPHNFEDIENYLKERSRTHLTSGIVPYRWIARDTNKDAKISRIKSVQSMSGHEPPTFHFVHGCGDLELIWDQFEHWVATKRSGKSDKSKDDSCDVCGIAVRTLNAAIITPSAPAAPQSNEPRNDRGQTESEFQKWNQERIQNAEYSRSQHARIFGQPPPQPKAPPKEGPDAKGAWQRVNGIFIRNTPQLNPLNLSMRRDKQGNLVKS